MNEQTKKSSAAVMRALEPLRPFEQWRILKSAALLLGLDLAGDPPPVTVVEVGGALEVVAREEKSA